MAYTIVSFCGGGIRGLMSATILSNLAQHNGNILTNTNLLAGTSTGSNIVSALVGGKSTRDIIDSFYDEAAFYSKGDSDSTAPAYSNSSYIKSQQQLHNSQTLASLTQKVLFTTFNLGSAPVDGAPPVPWSPQLFTNVPNPVVSNADTLIVDAVVSSGSMPAMLPSYNGNVDGAFVHHDPTLAAIALAVSSGIDINDIAAICIGTGFMANWIGSDTTQWGATQWLNGDGSFYPQNQVPPLLTNESETAPSPILNLCLNGTSTNLIPMLSQMLLSNRYVYLNPVLDTYVPETACSPGTLAYLVGQANALPADLMNQAYALLDTYW